MVAHWKPSRTARKIQVRRIRLDRKNHESRQKQEVRRRDGYRCRFPLCGCQKLGLALAARGEVSHQRHKGMGGNPTGDRSVAKEMILLCLHRHQDGAVSRHRGTLRARYLTRDKADGPLAWDVDLVAAKMSAERRYTLDGCVANWFEVARECAVQQLEPLTVRQQIVLEHLAEMML